MRYDPEVLISGAGRPCPGFPFSTDEWTQQMVATLYERLDAQRTPREKAAGVVIGPGGLPYIGSRLAVSSLIVSDLHRPVITTTLQRVQQVPRHDSWEVYDAEATARYDRPDSGYLQEVRRARESGLRGGYAATKTGLAAMTFHGVRGDILKTAPKIGDGLRALGQLVTFANVTNVADYLPHHEADPTGRRALWRALATLPLSEDVVIVDSSVDGYFGAVVYSPESYCETFDIPSKIVTLTDLLDGPE